MTIVNPRLIMSEMIAKGFPDLKNEIIILDYYTKRKGCFFEYSSSKDRIYGIDISETMENCPIIAFKGGLGHELSHIAREKSATKAQERLYKQCKEYRALEERETDLETIIRGYGRELLEFSRFADKIRPYKKEYGLSAGEIEILLNLKIR
jgi:hypothetical protein